MLVAAGANRMARDAGGRTPADIICIEGSEGRGGFECSQYEIQKIRGFLM